MHKHDYIAIAKAIKENMDNTQNDALYAEEFIDALCDILKADNPLFDAKKFKEATK